MAETPTVEGREAETITGRRRSPRTSQVNNLVMDLAGALVISFDPELSGTALTEAVEGAAQPLLDAIRKEGSPALVDKVTGFLAEILDLLRRREAWKAGGPVPRMPLFTRGYQVLSRAARNVLHAQVAAETTRLNVIFETTARIDSNSESLYKECEQIWPLIVGAQAEVAAAEADIDRAGLRLVEARRVLAGYRDRERGIQEALRELASSRKVVEDERARLFASRTARLIELTGSPLPDAGMTVSTREEDQQFAASEIDAIDLRINDIICDIHFL